MKVKKSLALAVSLILSSIAEAAADDLNKSNNRIDVYSSGSFNVSIDELSAKPAVINDIKSLLGKYEGKVLSIEELESVASELQFGLRMYGYNASVDILNCPNTDKPLSFAITLNDESTDVNREAIVSALKKSSNLNEEQTLEESLANAASAIQGGIEAEDKEAWAMSQAKSYAENLASNTFNETVGKFGDNIKSQIRLTYDEEEQTVLPTGKILIPFVDHSRYTIFGQLSFNESYNDRYLGHVGAGIRVFPNATSLKDRGNYGFGLNTFYDHDFSRGHKRFSIGAEFLYDTFSLSGNLYQRISSWKSSEDFDSYLVEERPANGWELRAKWAFPWYTPLQFSAAYTKWYGDQVGAFGADSVDDLEKDPDVYELGASLALTNSISIDATHKTTDSGNDTQIALNFTIPLDNSIVDAFKPAQNGVINTINEAPYAFVNRDETMPLEYREKSGRFAISYLGMRGLNTHEFGLATGLNSGKANFSGVTVTPYDQCVLLNNNGSYVTDNRGLFTARILSTINCPQPYTQAKVRVSAGNSSKDFTLSVSPESFNIDVTHQLIHDSEESVIVIEGSPASLYRISSSYTEQDVNFGNDPSNENAISRARTAKPYALYFNDEVLKDGDTFKTDSNGFAEILFKPDPSAKIEYRADIVVTSAVSGQFETTYVEVGKTVDLDWGEIGDGTIVWGDSNGNGIPDIELPLTGGKPGDEITISGPDADDVIIMDQDGNTPPKFDESGNADIIIEKKPDAVDDTGNTNISIDAGEGGSTDVTITYEDFNPILNTPEKVIYGQEFTVSVSDAKPNSIIKFGPVNGNGAQPDPAEVKADLQGNATVTYPGITAFDTDNLVKIDVEVAAKASSDETKIISKDLQLSLPDFDLGEQLPEGDLVFGDEDGDGLGDISFDLEGGVPGQGVVIGGEDPDKVIITDQDGNTPPRFDENGNITIIIEEKEPDSGAINIDVGLEGDDPANSEQITIIPSQFKPMVSVAESINYLTEIPVTVEKAAPNSEITFKEQNGLTIADPAIVTTDNSGSAHTVFAGVTDFSASEINLVIGYVVDPEGNTAELVKNIKINDFSFSFDPLAIENIININNPIVYTLSGGTQGQAIFWEIEGDAQIQDESKSTIFDEQGKASLTVLPKAPYSADVVVKATSMSRTAQSKPLPYALEQREIAFDYSTLNFKGQERTIDYKLPFEVVANNLTPNTTVKLSAQDFLSPEQSEIIADETGKAVLKFSGITNTSIDSFNITGTYQTTESELSQKEFSTDTIYLYQWDIDNAGMTFDPSLGGGQELDGYNEIELTIAGGRPNSPISFAIGSGTAQIVSSDSQTDGSGTAKVTIQAVAPYDEATPVKVVATHMGNKIESGEIHINLKDVNSADLDTKVSPLVNDELDYDTEFEVAVSGLLPNSKVEWVQDGDVVPQQASTIANENCQGSGESQKCSTHVKFNGIANYSRTILDNVKLKYARSLAELDNPQGELTLEPINLKQYAVTSSHDGDDNFIDDTEVVTVSFTGGKANQPISIELEEVNRQLTAEFEGSVPQTMDGSGNAEVKVKLKAPYQGDFKVILTHMGKKFESKTFVAQPLTHEAAFAVSPTKGGDNTIDYRTPFTVTISSNENHGLIEGSTVYWDTDDSQGVKPNAETSTVTSGTASMTFEGIGDSHILVESLNITGRYAYSMADPEHQFSHALALYQYGNDLSFADSKDHVDAGESFEVVLSNARDGESVKFELTDGAADASFEGSNTATVLYQASIVKTIRSTTTPPLILALLAQGLILKFQLVLKMAVALLRPFQAQ